VLVKMPDKTIKRANPCRRSIHILSGALPQCASAHATDLPHPPALCAVRRTACPIAAPLRLQARRQSRRWLESGVARHFMKTACPKGWRAARRLRSPTSRGPDPAALPAMPGPRRHRAATGVPRQAARSREQHPARRPFLSRTWRVQATNRASPWLSRHQRRADRFSSS